MTHSAEDPGVWTEDAIEGIFSHVRALGFIDAAAFERGGPTGEPGRAAPPG